MPDAEYLIVGQGLAGSMLAHRLLKTGKTVIVIDDKKENTSSKAAAGLFNPITGQRMVLTWKAHTLFNYLHSYYKHLEQELGASFFHPVNVYKPFLSIKDYNDWMGRSSDASYQDFVEKIHDKSLYPELIDDSRGGVELKRSGYVNIKTLLSAFERYFIKKNAFIREKFSYNSLYLKEKLAVYGDIKVEKAIFCEGPEAVNNPFFQKAPFGLVKGETLTIELEGRSEHIISKDIFVVPLMNGLYKVGATYDRDDLAPGKTAVARKYLVEKLQKLIKADFKIVDQEAGIRPATKDRRPFIGMHPEKKLVGIFNGLGAKGVSLAPFFAKQFADHLTQSQELNKEVDIRRYL